MPFPHQHYPFLRFTLFILYFLLLLFFFSLSTFEYHNINSNSSNSSSSSKSNTAMRSQSSSFSSHFDLLSPSVVSIFFHLNYWGPEDIRINKMKSMRVMKIGNSMRTRFNVIHINKREHFVVMFSLFFVCLVFRWKHDTRCSMFTSPLK